MKITIENFRCFSGKSAAERVFEEFSVNLFSGVSGRGKSSTFYALLWCLFGKTRGIKPNSEECCKPKTRVILEFDGMTIMREKKPEVLLFEQDETVHEGKIAQEKIYQLFGNEELFIATSFLQQKGAHPLVYLSNAEKFALLYNLTFGYSSNEKFTPENYLVQVAKETLAKTNELKSIEGVKCYLQGKYNSEKHKFSDLEKELSAFGSFEELKKAETVLEEEINSMKSDAVKKEKVRGLFLKEKGKRDFLEANLKREKEIFDSAQAAFEKLIEVPEPRIDELSEKIDILETFNSIQEEIDKLDIDDLVLDFADEFAEAAESCANIHKFLKRFKLKTIEQGVKRAGEIVSKSETFDQLIKEEELRKKAHQDLVEKLKLEHTEAKLEAVKLEAKNSQILHGRKQLEAYQNNLRELEEYSGKLSKLDTFKKNLSKESITLGFGDTFPSAKTIDKKLNSMARTLECLTCPECEVSLTVKDQKLIKVLDVDERTELESSYDTLKKFHQKLLQFELQTVRLGTKPKELPNPNFVDSELAEIKVKELKLPKYIPQEIKQEFTEQEVFLAKSFLVETSHSRFPEKINIDKLQNGFSNYPIYKRLKTKLSVLEAPEESLNALARERSCLIKLKREFSTAKKNFDDAKASLNRTKESLDKCVLPEFNSEEFEELEKELKFKENFLLKMKEYIVFEETKRDLESRTETVNSLAEQVKILNELKKTAENVSIESISERIICLEQTTNTLLSVLFEEKPIRVSIKAVKESKTKGLADKNQVNLTIFRNSNELKTLSGGESSRFNLALTMAMNLISGSKMLLLDEVLDGIEEELKETTIKLVKKYCFMKTVVFICHNSVKGMYDNVVTLK